MAEADATGGGIHWDLIVTENNDVFLSCNGALPGEPKAVTVFRDNRLMRLDFGDDTDLLFEQEVDASFIPQLEAAPYAVIVEMDGVEAKSGFRVPISVEG